MKHVEQICYNLSKSIDLLLLLWTGHCTFRSVTNDDVRVAYCMLLKSSQSNQTFIIFISYMISPEFGLLYIQKLECLKDHLKSNLVFLWQWLRLTTESCCWHHGQSCQWPEVRRQDFESLLTFLLQNISVNIKETTLNKRLHCIKKEAQQIQILLSGAIQHVLAWRTFIYSSRLTLNLTLNGDRCVAQGQRIWYGTRPVWEMEAIS